MIAPSYFGALNVKEMIKSLDAKIIVIYFPYNETDDIVMSATQEKFEKTRKQGVETENLKTSQYILKNN